MLVLEAVLLWQGRIVFLFLLDMAHIKVRFTEELGGLELIGFFKVHTLHSGCFSRCEVSCCLSADPTCSHIGNLGGRNQTVHLLIIRGRDTLIINADALSSLLHLAEDVILQPFQRFLVSGRTRKNITTDRNDLSFKNLR